MLLLLTTHDICGSNPTQFSIWFAINKRLNEPIGSLHSQRPEPIE